MNEEELKLQQRLLELEEEEAIASQNVAKPAAIPKPKQSDIGGLEAFGMGVSEALSPIAKYGAAAGIKARTAYEDIKRGKPSLGVPYFDVAVPTAEELQSEAKAERPGAYYSGTGLGILGGVGLSLPAKIPGALGVLGIGAGAGAAQSAGAVPYEEATPTELLKSGGIGALVGGAAAGIPLAFGARGPIIEGAKAAIKGAEGKGTIGGLYSAITEAPPAMRGAARETAAFKEVAQKARSQSAIPLSEMGLVSPDLQNFQGAISQAAAKPPAQTVGQYLKSGTQVTPEEESQFLLNLLQPGKTPAKEFYTQKATQLYPGQTGPKQLQSVLEMPLEQRVQAREFDPSLMGKQLQPQAELAKEALGKKGAAFQKLQEIASQEYKRTQLPSVSNAIKLAKNEFDRPGTTRLTKNTIGEIDTIINRGSALPGYGITDGPLKSANAAEAYKRLQAAREYADRAIELNPNDVSIQRILQPVRDSLDDVLKSSPSKVIADKLYSQGLQVEALGITPLEMQVGTNRILSGTNIKTALGDTIKGEKIGLGIEEARAFTKEFGEQLGPKEAAKIDKFFNALADARTVADRKRILDDLKFAEGPSGAAIRAGIAKLEQTIKPSPGGASMFKAAPEYLQSVDAFMSENAQKYFGKSFDKLKGEQQYKLVNAFQWMKENPNAAQSEVSEKFNTIMRGKSK